MSRHQRYALSGTTCGSCEALIERELRELPGVLSVEAHHDKGTLDIHAGNDAVVSLKAINKAISSHGYHASEERAAAERRRVPDLRHLGGSLVLILATYLVMRTTGLLSIGPSPDSPSGLFAVFGIGLVAAFSSCTAMLAGMVAAFSASSARRGGSASARMAPHLWFNLGRLAGYALFGAAIGAMGGIIALSPGANAVFVLAVALLMVAMGLHLLELAPAWARLRPPRAIARRIDRFTSSDAPGVPFVAGALTFFLPCGFTQSMQLYALSTGDPWRAAAVMTVFALGTAPALIGLGVATSAAKGRALRRVTRFAGAFIVVLGMANVANASALLGIRIPDGGGRAADAVAAVIDGGEQVLNMEITRNFTYAPDTFTVTEGVPVVWNVYGNEWMGCADTLVLRQFGVNTRLSPGFNEVRFVPDRPGTYTFSCSMGMIRGTLIVLPQEDR